MNECAWDALDQRIWQHVPIPANIQQLYRAIEEEWTNIPQATIDNLFFLLIATTPSHTLHLEIG